MTGQPRIGDSTWDSGTPGCFPGVDGIPIEHRSFLRPDQRGAVVISSGRTEFMLKYVETVETLGAAGYSAYLFDHRGQGFSGRLARDPEVGHVERFEDYVEDLATFVDRVVRPSQAALAPAAGRELFLLAHSMGACIASLYLQQRKRDFAAAVFTAPMYRPITPVPERIAAWITAPWRWLGRGDHYLPGSGPWRDVAFRDIANKGRMALTHDEGRYEVARRLCQVFPELRVGGASCNWGNEAIRAARRARRRAGEIEAPVLLLQAGEDAVVSAAGQREFERNAPSCELLSIPGGYHELLIEEDAYRNAAVARVLAFFDEHTP